jgi:hypothetical protein
MQSPEKEKWQRQCWKCEAVEKKRSQRRPRRSACRHCGVGWPAWIRQRNWSAGAQVDGDMLAERRILDTVEHK